MESEKTVDETEAPERLNLEVQIASPSACQRHITVTVPHDDLERYYSKAFDELMPSATVPGFRAGRAPRKLVEHRFRKDLAPQVKGSLLMDSMAQISEDHKLAAISEPKIDVEAIELPESGSLSFEFDLEVRPEFDMPQWKGLSIERPIKQFTEKDVDQQLARLLERYGRLVPFSGGAQTDDFIVANIRFRDGDETISETQEQTLRIRPTLSFRDGKLEKFDKLMKGAKAGETRKGQTKISEDAPKESLRGKTIDAEFEVLEVKKLEPPELTKEFLEELGGFQSVDELRTALRGELERQLEYHQQQRARKQITQALTASASWELPPDLLRRQAQRELNRAVLELRRSGFGDDAIQAHQNELRQNSMQSTARALKEHFILERIAEDENITDEPSDYDDEIRLIAAQSGESVRRVRAQLEKRELMDVLRNQIVERKTVALVQSHAKFKDVAYQPEGAEVEAVDQSASGEEGEAEIPEAMYPGEAQTRPGTPDQHD